MAKQNFSLEQAKILFDESIREGSSASAVAKLQTAVQNILGVLQSAELRTVEPIDVSANPAE